MGEPRRFGRDAACNVSISRRRFLNPGILMNRQVFFVNSFTHYSYPLSLIVVVICLVLSGIILLLYASVALVFMQARSMT